MVDYIVSMQVLLLALCAYIGIHARMVQHCYAARQDCYEQRLQSRRKVIIKHFLFPYHSERNMLMLC